MLGRIEHVALAVSDLDAAVRHYTDVWGLQVGAREVVADQGVEEATLEVEGTSLQLIAALDERSTVARFIARRGEGLHHIAYEVDDVEAALERLRAGGVRLVDEVPRRGGGGRLVAFVHPASNHGLLVELVQAAARTGE
jgi:methylmalonyl-CoA/ethylmalonyl-CoA epimerase